METTRLYTFPDDDKDYCKGFTVPTAWLVKAIEDMYPFDKGENIRLERFLETYLWDETWHIYCLAKWAGKVISEEEIK